MNAGQNAVTPVYETPIDVFGHVDHVEHGHQPRLDLGLTHMRGQKADAHAMHHRLFDRFVG
jgi:hypothetical protein